MRIHRATASAIGLSLALALSGPAFATDKSSGSSGGTSGPAAGGNVQPGSEAKPPPQGDQPTATGGGPGVQGQPGKQSGPAPEKSESK
jgi:hypothetical protein